MSVTISGLPGGDKPDPNIKDKKYWKSLGEKNDPEGYQKSIRNEFREKLPFDEPDELLQAKTPRRDFLKYLGFGTAAATLAASCEIKTRKVIPYLNKPEEITPGVPNYYASTYAVDGEYCPIIIKTRDGRPIKIEGNTDSSITRGGTSAVVQASVLSLYDVTRLRYPLAKGKEATWQAVDQQVMNGLSQAGGPVVLLTAPILSPSIKSAIEAFLAKYPGSRHVVYEPMSYNGLLLGNEKSYGKRAIPAYHFENAKSIVSLGADFMGTWLSPIAFTRQYIANRKIDQKNPEMSRHFQFESAFSLSGSNADYRYPHRPSDTAGILIALYNEVAAGVGQPTLSGGGLKDQKLVKGVKKAAGSLLANRGASLVVSDNNNPDAQVLVNAINDMLGNGGHTIDWSVEVNYHSGIDAEMEQLVADMNAGNIGALILYDVNPVYDYYAPDKFVAGLKKTGLTVSLNDHNDETTQLCGYAAPDNHFLESWGDAEPQTGYYSLQQPGISRLFKTRQALSTLLKWGGAADIEPLNYIQNYWKENIYPKYGQGDQWQHWWDKTLQLGLAEPVAPAIGTAASFVGDVNGAASSLKATAPKAGGVEVVLYENVAIRNGRHSNNPWLQEMPEPLTKCTWDNYVCVSPAMSRKLNAAINRFNEVNYNRPLAKVTVNGKDVLLPIMVLPGMHKDVIAVAVGYGRGGNDLKGEELNKWRNAIGPSAASIGKNVYPWVTYNATSQSRIFTAGKVDISNTGETYLLAITQSHSSFEGRPIIEETTLDQFKKDPEHLLKERKEEFSKYGDDYAKDATLYPQIHDYSQGIHWNMAIDMNACIGCGACTIACYAENNVSVVGKEEVARGHEMSWIRIDRYFAGSEENPQVVYQPMLCQQCNNAPCENVCPVAATSHSNEGLNMMVYNRCIGTRYCENNCPYKVRRFNWRDWNGADSFDANMYDDPVVLDMNKDLTRMVLNPDVTVRGRGVMEKCMFCVQRLQIAKLNAKKAGRPVKDGEAKTACQQACPANAISFGNINDKDSEIYKITKEEQTTRGYHVLELLHTLPNITYLAKVRNKDQEDFFHEEPQHTL